MRPFIALALLLPACADETAATFAGGGGDGSSSSTGSTSANTSGDVAVPTTGETSTATGTGSGGFVDPMTSGEPESTTSSSTTGVTTEHGETTNTSVGTNTGADTSTGIAENSSGEPAASCDDSVPNQDETDVDCGGGVCPQCSLDLACMSDADCVSGWCEGQVCTQPGCLADADCDPLDEPCVEATCDLVSKTCLLAPSNEGQACEDGDLCTTGEACDKGGCLGGAAKDCSGLDNVCGHGLCDAQSGDCVAQAFPEMEGELCDDSFVCTPDDVCAQGLCGVGGPGYLFFENFTAPDAGWELGPTWEVGPAIASPAGWNGADPDSDHSPGNDDMIAGTIIGGLVPQGALDKTCLTSPAVDAGLPGEPGELRLSFWRHLHTDYYPFAAHTVEVYDGEMWQVVAVGYADPGANDSDWTFFDYDVTPYKNSVMRVRVCHAQTANAFQAAGWSLDDVTLGPYACTPED